MSVRPFLERLRAWEPTALQVYLAVFGPLIALYVLVPNPGLHPRGNHIDATTNAVTSWHMAMKRTVILAEYAEATAPDYYRNIGWYVDSPRGPVSQYPPGAAAFGAPFYLIANDPAKYGWVAGNNRPDAPPILLPVPSVRPGQVAASLAVAGAMGFVALSVLATGASWPLAVGAGLVGGIGTTMWPVAASALWQHGPGSFWVALGTYLAARDRLFLSGLAVGGAILTRPHLASVALGIGLAVAWHRKRIRPAILVGSGSAIGLAALLTYNWWLWGRVTIRGGYSESFVENLASPDLLGLVRNVFGALFDPAVGLFIISPFLVLLVIRLAPAWREAPAWSRGAAMGGVLYLLLQLKANRYSGGGGFVGYRYPLEALTAAGPLLALAYPDWARKSKVARVGFWLLVMGSVIVFLRYWSN